MLCCLGRTSQDQNTASPTRLISPDTLMKNRRGNSFEMATLLCSLLIGNGYAAMVVNGYASREVANNNQTRVECPYTPSTSSTDANGTTQSEQNIKTVEKKVESKYKLRDAIDLQSKFLLELEDKKKRQTEAEREWAFEEKRRERKALERLDEDEFHGWRVHSWVAIVTNASWAVKKSVADSDQSQTEDNHAEARAFFIEPSTGFHFDTNDPNYLGIESVWNQYNYYVNCQEPISDLPAMRWDFQNTEDWQFLLAGEPSIDSCSTNVAGAVSINTNSDIDVHREKHLDMPNWVRKLVLSNSDYDERYPGGHKTIHYMRATYDRFAPYFNRNGLIKQLTLYETLEYTDELWRWEWYENREDLMEFIVHDFKANKVVEHFAKGRKDFLLRYTYSSEIMSEKVFEYNYGSRLDVLKSLVVHPLYICENYESRNDFLCHREFRKTEEDKLIEIVEKFHRNAQKLACQDIASRTFDIANSKITLQFHYGYDEITPTIRVYKKPPPPDYGCEVIFNEQENEVDQANQHEKDVPKLDRYLMLLEQLRCEAKSILAYETRRTEIENTLMGRLTDHENPILTFSIYDRLRNSAARNLRMAKYEEVDRQKELFLKSEPDFLAPYLVKYADRKLNLSESMKVYNSCLTDFERDYSDLLNELQQKYEEFVLDEQDLKKFLNKFHDKLDDFEYDDFVKDGEKLEFQKKIMQQRIINTEVEFQEKYNKLRDSLLNDDRLSLDADFRQKQYQA